ncbi:MULTISPECIES: rhamnogalacturonan acetylesterase [unclassified Sphingobacterium]|uniref:rhamnogalacturonan acetylesterase n=1 Tax=unclassified Sphingobacterium TaxID=2609468 RepID=UPI002955AAD2|nr:rhamnogalacturonan acetylesterase [Sphingobacterium sp. UGAL515B_05]WON96792.1 rhamnogalacturonan acetylesterase [Sphingobacterium sp. UGAL515B_05]
MKLKLLPWAVVLFAVISMSFLEKQHKPTLFIIGDSTVKNGQGNGANGQWGWGSLIGQYFKLDKINVKNRALGGTSTRTFYNNPKLWQRVLDSIQPGDFVLMQFGHNDSSPIVDTLRARGTIKGNGDDYQEVYNPLLKQHEVVYSYGFYLRRFVKNIQDKGATAIICSPIPRNAWEGNQVRKSDYATWAKEAAQQANAFFIPLQDQVIAQYETLGKKKVETEFFDPKDATHTIKAGALLNAKLVAEQLKAQTKIGLKKFM